MHVVAGDTGNRLSTQYQTASGVRCRGDVQILTATADAVAVIVALAATTRHREVALVARVGACEFVGVQHMTGVWCMWQCGHGYLLSLAVPEGYSLISANIGTNSQSGQD